MTLSERFDKVKNPKDASEVLGAFIEWCNDENAEYEEPKPMTEEERREWVSSTLCG